MKSNPFGIVIPPGGRPHWISSEDKLDLIYLSWGWRRYGDAPLPRSHTIGWEYTCLLGGNPVFEVDAAKVRLKVGQLIVTGPGRVITISDKPGLQCQILTWLWGSPPKIPDVDSGTYWKSRVADPATRKKILGLHAQTRQEVAKPDRLTPWALARIHLELDVVLTRMRSADRASAATRFELAEKYIFQHPEIHDPLSALSDYLQISKASVKRLFSSRNRSIREMSCQCRMKAARTMLSEGKFLIKEVAFRLGYAHSNDFTRAYTAHFGTAPSHYRMKEQRSA